MTKNTDQETVEQIAKYVEDFSQGKVLSNKECELFLSIFSEFAKQSVKQISAQQKDGNSTYREGIKALKNITSSSTNFESKKEMADYILKVLQEQRETTKNNNEFWLGFSKYATVGVCCLAAIVTAGYVAVKKT